MLPELKGLANSQPEHSKNLLQVEWKRQSEIMAKYFAKELHLSEEEYMLSLPKFPEKPTSYDEFHLTVPLIGEGRIPWQRKAELSGIQLSDYLRKKIHLVKDWKELTPERPYTFWAQDGTRFVNMRPAHARNKLSQFEVGGTISEGLDYWNARPDIVRENFFDLIGSSSGFALVPYLRIWNGMPRLSSHGIDYAFPNFRALVRGSQIGT